MATIKLDIAPSVLQWIRLSYSDKLDDSLIQKMDSWIAEEKKPTFGDIEKLSGKTRVPFGYFFLHEPPKENLPILEYRTVNSKEFTSPSRELIDIISYMESVQSYLRDFRQENGYEKCEAVGSGINLSLHGLTTHIREFLALEKEWYRKAREDTFNFLRSKLEDVGVTVMKNGIVANNTKRALNYNEFRAFTMIDDYAPLIFINSTDTSNGQLFSLMHEFTHIVLGESNFYNVGTSSIVTDNENERVCNAVTGEILVPNDIFIERWSRDNDTEKLARHFHCSEIVIARKALDNNYITSNRYNGICEVVIKKAEESKAKRKEEDPGGHFYNTAKSRIDKHFLEAVYIGVSEGNITYTEAYRLTNTKRTSFMGLIEQTPLGGVV